MMSANTAIAWTESTWNPLIGCTKISPGCSVPGTWAFDVSSSSR
jgi:protein gp37